MQEWMTDKVIAKEKIAEVDMDERRWRSAWELTAEEAENVISELKTEKRFSQAADYCSAVSARAGERHEALTCSGVSR